MADTLGRQSGGTGEGPGGDCICPKCETKVTHKLGVPCYQMKCPKCYAVMERIVSKK